MAIYTEWTSVYGVTTQKRALGLHVQREVLQVELIISENTIHLMKCMWRTVTRNGLEWTKQTNQGPI